MTIFIFIFLCSFINFYFSVKGVCGAGRLMKLVLVISMMAWLKEYFMNQEMNEEQEETEAVVIEDCAGATCSLG